MSEQENIHIMICPDCGEKFDCRDLGQVFEHIHDREAPKDPYFSSSSKVGEGIIYPNPKTQN